MIEDKKMRFSNKEFWIIGIPLGSFVLVSRIFFPNDIFLGGLLPTIGLLLGFWIVKFLRKSNKK